VSWDQRFFDPIPVPGRKPLITLRDAALYITKLPKAEHDAQEWQAAMQALLLVAEHDGPTMFARIAVMRALTRRYATARPIQTAYHRMRFGRSAIQSNDIALFMLQQRRRTSSFHFALRHAATCGSRAHVYFRVGIAGLSARGARVPSLAFLTRKQQPH
jgi:hypothetical protein